MPPRCATRSPQCGRPAPEGGALLGERLHLGTLLVGQPAHGGLDHLGIVEGCGYEKRGPKNLRLIQEAMESAELYPEPRLTALGLKQEDLVYFSLVRPKPYRDEDYEGLRAFANEEQLENFLIENFDRIPAFKSFKEPKRQFKIPGTKWEVDVLCRERISNGYVVIELKFDKSAYPISNLGKYLPAIESKLAKPAGWVGESRRHRLLGRDFRPWDGPVPSSQIANCPSRAIHRDPEGSDCRASPVAHAS